MSIRRRTIWAGVAFGACCLAYQWWTHHAVVHSTQTATPPVLLFVPVISHVIINLLLLWVFGRTLRRGHEPLITGFARAVHGTLPPPLESYTRNVTRAWCIVFALQVIVCAALFLFASPELGSLFVNVLSFPLVVATFVVEYVYRIMRFREFPHVSIWAGIRLFVERRSREGAHAMPLNAQRDV